ncbi:hypothetical protein PIB30_074454 [Stylosanthes scabra]|uniref:Uncharacterized protein n=1 Tax=Stylosanthes scabra TaxID=79078 RepID=A0ABU6RPP1_9FABA|nr:hypothetical protein [Stylosanthes scabra]
MGSSDEESENQVGGSFTELDEGDRGYIGEDDIVQGIGGDTSVDEDLGNDFYDDWHEKAVDGIAEIGQINLKEIGGSEIKKLHFQDRNIAFSFYKLYAKMNGFAVRKNRMRRNKYNEVIQKQFVRFREWYRET